ncbi:MAG: T9SS type B sorting domain-containing protein, partial [Hymenobacter sp.]
TLTATNPATGCVNTGTVAVTVNPLPVANAGAAVRLCSGGWAGLGASPVGNYTYSWSPATGLSSSTVANPTITLTNTTGAATTQIYTLTVTNSATSCLSTGTVAVTVNPLPVANTGAAVTLTATNPATGCVNTGTVAVTVNPLPVANAGAAVRLCSGGSAGLGARPVGNYTYSWSPATGLSSTTVADPTVTLTNSGPAAITQIYTLTVTGLGNCTTTSTVAVTVNPLPVAVAGPPVTFCSGNTTQLGIAPVAGNTYSWSPATGLSNSAVANPNITLTNTTGAALTPTYTLTVTNPVTGCVNTSTVVVTVNSEILPGVITASQAVCASSTPTPLTSVPGPTGGYGTYSYQWESSPDNVTWTPVPGANADTYAPGPLAATIYYRRRVASGSCADAVSNAVMLELVPLATSAVTLATPPAQCPGLPITFTPVPTNVGGSPTYRWLINNVPVATGPTFTSSTLANGDVVRVEVTPTPGFCATGPAIASVTVNLILVAQPTVVIRTQTALPICAGSPVVFEIDNTTNTGPTNTYQWQVNGVNVPGATAATFTSTTLTNGQVVTLVLRTPSACGIIAATSNGLAIGVNPLVQVNAGPDKTIMEGETVVLEGTASGNFPITWTPNLGFTFPTNNPLRPTAAPIVTTTYTLAAQIGNCYGESKVTITVTPRVRIPNAFTPNGDGQDDTWQIDHISDYPNNHVTIFNRWGTKLFDTSNYNRGNEWNGTMNGLPAPIGTYYYLITLGNGKSYTGPLTVVY